MITVYSLECEYCENCNINLPVILNCSEEEVCFSSNSGNINSRGCRKEIFQYVTSKMFCIFTDRIDKCFCSRNLCNKNFLPQKEISTRKKSNSI